MNSTLRASLSSLAMMSVALHAQHRSSARASRGAITPFAALYLDDLLDKLPPATIQIAAHGILLSFQPETTRPLPSDGDAVVGDELALSHVLPMQLRSMMVV